MVAICVQQLEVLINLDLAHVQHVVVKERSDQHKVFFLSSDLAQLVAGKVLR